jgi:hypothetical protein
MLAERRVNGLADCAPLNQCGEEAGGLATNCEIAAQKKVGWLGLCAGNDLSSNRISITLALEAASVPRYRMIRFLGVGSNLDSRFSRFQSMLASFGLFPRFYAAANL